MCNVDGDGITVYVLSHGWGGVCGQHYGTIGTIESHLY